MTRHLVVMLKEPLPGRVKTRLGRDMGMIPAAWWFRHQAQALVRRLDDPRWRLWLAVSPDIKGLKSRIWSAHLPRIPQGAGDLGDRMARLFRSLPAGPVCVIGADIPAVQPHHIARAFQVLGRNDAVFGPASDGGYWLIGMKRVAATPAGLFAGARWSTEFTLEDSVRTLGGKRVGYCDQLSDIDTQEDLISFEKAAKIGAEKQVPRG